MIKVFTGYKVKEDADMQPLLLKLWSHAAQYVGFIGAENLVSQQDYSIVAMVSTWEKVENWREWEGSQIRRDILRGVEDILDEEPRVTIYRIMPTVRWRK